MEIASALTRSVFSQVYNEVHFFERIILLAHNAHYIPKRFLIAQVILLLHFMSACVISEQLSTLSSVFLKYIVHTMYKPARLTIISIMLQIFLYRFVCLFLFPYLNVWQLFCICESPYML